MTATPDVIPSDLTLEIDADLSPDRFIAAVRAFFGYVKDISDAVGQDETQIGWRVVVKEGSSLIGVEPNHSAPMPMVRAVYAKAARGIESVRAGDIDGAGLSESALKHLRALSEVATADRKKPIPLRVWVERKPVQMTAEIGNTIAEDWRSAYSDFGTIEGRLETIQDRGTLLIYVRDTLYQSTIRCYFSEELLPRVFDCFRKRVEITGEIHYRRNGTPISIEAASINPLPDDAELPSADDVRGIFRANA